MDMERAALQQQLVEVQKENDMLRLRAVGPRTNSFSSPSGSRDSSPLPTPRSFGRPKARGISTGFTRDRDTDGGGAAWSPERGYGHGWRGRRDHGRPASGRVRRLEDVLGTRVRLVQLVGLDELAGRANGPGSTRPCGQPPRLSRAEELRVAESSAEAPPSLDTYRRGGRDAFPWSKESALWYGLVTLIVAPSPGAIKELSKTPPAHAILLTDVALYVIEVPTPEAGEGRDEGGRGRAGGDNLCRIERRRVERLSLPLEMRALPSGDEVAVRSSSVVVRLRLLSDDRGGRYDGGGRIAAAAGVERGYLWLSCENNEARGDLVEHLSQWYHKWDENEARGDIPNDSSGDFSPSDVDAASAASAAAVAAAAVAAVAASGGSFSSSEAANGSDEDDDALEVEQILIKELVEELGQERSLNVTALLLVDKDTLAPLGERR
ncbi:unnamed protein product [Ascophyllum nodosum]